MMEYNPWRSFNESIEAMSYMFFFLIAAMSVHLYITAPPIVKGEVQWLVCIAYVLIGIGELLILYLAIGSRVEIYKMDHPKKVKVYPSEQVCGGAVS
jgi:cytosine/uracil/thiamine/allantoin permease